MDEPRTISIEDAEAFRKLGEEADQGLEEVFKDETSKSRRKREWKRLRDRDITIACASNEFSNGTNETLTVKKLFDLCADHQESNSKSGTGFIQGSLVDDAPTERGKNINAGNVAGMSLMTLDCDSGQTVQEATEMLRKHGIAYVVYSSFNNGKTRTEISCERFLNFTIDRGNDGEPSLDDARAYLIEKLRIVPDIANTVLKVEPTSDGEQQGYIVTHDAIAKFRIVVPLNEPFLIHDQDKKTLSKNRNVWRSVYKQVCDDFGIKFDAACTDVGRFYFLPRHPPGAEHFTYLKKGGPLDLAPYIAKAKEETTAGKSSSRRGGRSDNPSQIIAIKPDGTEVNLIDWVVAGGKWFRIADVMNDFDADNIKRDRGNKLEVFCPYDGNHTEPGEDGFFVKNADREVDESWSASCRHTGCSHLNSDRLEFLKGLLERTPELWGALVKEKYYDRIEVDESFDFGAVRRVLSGKTISDLPQPFFRKDGQIFEEKPTNGEESKRVLICQDFKVVGQTNNEDGEGWGLVIEFSDPAGRQKEVAIPKSTIAGSNSEALKYLSDQGLSIDLTTGAKNSFVKLLSRLKPEKIITTVKQPGFHHNSFLTPMGQVIGAVDGELRLHHNGGAKDREVKGSLEGWKENISSKCFDRRTPHWALSLCCGTAAVLIQLLDEPSCGINWSGTSSLGKSTGQMIAAGVWANPAPGKGLMHTARGTDNAFEAIAAKSNACGLHIDELSQGQEKTISQLLFMLSGGAGKARLTSTASLRPEHNWKTFVTLSGEEGLKKYIERGGKDYIAGHGVRFPDIDVSGLEQIEAEVAKGIKDASLKHYGHAGTVLVQYLYDHGFVDDPEQLRKAIQDKAAKIAGKGAAPTLRRAAGTFALLWQTGEIMQAAGLIPSDVKVKAPIKWAWETYKQSAEAEALKPQERGKNAIQDWLLKNWGKTVVGLSAGSDSNYRETDAWFNKDYVYLPVTTLQKIPGVVGSDRALRRHLHETGALIKSGEKNFVHRRIPGMGDMNHLRLKREHFGKSDKEVS